MYQTAGGEFWVALNDENVVIGTAALRSLNQNESELKRLYIDPAYRGKGIGRNLTQLIIKKAKEAGFKTIKLDTSKKAYNFFQKIGFREIKPYFDNNLAEVFMELGLKEK